MGHYQPHLDSKVTLIALSSWWVTCLERSKLYSTFILTSHPYSAEIPSVPSNPGWNFRLKKIRFLRQCFSLSRVLRKIKDAFRNHLVILQVIMLYKVDDAKNWAISAAISSELGYKCFMQDQLHVRWPDISDTGAFTGPWNTMKLCFLSCLILLKNVDAFCELITDLQIAKLVGQTSCEVLHDVRRELNALNRSTTFAQLLTYPGWTYIQVHNGRFFLLRVFGITGGPLKGTQCVHHGTALIRLLWQPF